MIHLTGRPLMYDEEVSAIEGLIRSIGPKRFLEWGSGGSTLHFPKLFPDLEWTSIEHSKEYADAVRAAATDNVDIRHLSTPQYYEEPEKMGKKFDMILVDGIRRVECLSRARRLLADGGIVILHDAGRARYSPAYKFFQEHEFLVNPIQADDNHVRGVMVFRGPVMNSMRDATVIDGSCGVMYLCWGDPARLEAEASMHSLWSVDSGTPVTVLGDDLAVEYFHDVPNVSVEYCEVNPFSSKSRSSQAFLAGRVKPLLDRYSPYERTIYVDAETEFKRSTSAMFKLLDNWDFVIAEAETRDLSMPFPDRASEARDTAEMLGTPLILYHNSGVFAWRKCDATAELFRSWATEWSKYEGWDEQISLLRALMREADLIFLNLPYTWNCRQEVDTYFVYHRFASMSARKFSARVSAPAIPRVERQIPVTLVKVEVSPGMIVKCKPGDEQKVKDMLSQRGGGRVRSR